MYVFNAIAAPPNELTTKTHTKILRPTKFSNNHYKAKIEIRKFSNFGLTTLQVSVRLEATKVVIQLAIRAKREREV